MFRYTHKSICQSLTVVMICLGGLLHGAGISLLAQDTRTVTEPTFPSTCAVLHAPLHSTSDGPTVGPSQDEQDAASTPETQLLQAALDSDTCHPGQAVELALGSDPSLNAFLIEPITVPAGISLIIDGGVTVYGSRDPAVYQVKPPDPSGATCGMIGPWPINAGCNPLITVSSNTGIYGNGVIDSQGDKIMLGNPKGATWWDLTTYKKGAANQDGTCQQPDPNSNNDVGDSTSGTTVCEQESPLVISSPIVPGATITNLTFYKITIRNPPYHTTRLIGQDLTVWGVKVQAPWNLPNTDGFDVRATNATFYDDTVANGDQEITVVSSGGPTCHMTIENFHGYGKGGITILGNGDSTSHVLVKNAQITGDLPSVVSATVDGQTEMVVNGIPFSQMKVQNKPLQSWGQALPNATNDLKALQISNASSNSVAGSQISDVTFSSVCISDIVKPIDISLGNSSPPGFAHNILFQDVHVLKPTMQFPAMQKGKVADPLALGSYELYFDAPSDTQPNLITFDNLVFDDSEPGTSSISSISAHNNQFTALTNVYPKALNELDLTDPSGSSGSIYFSLANNSYLSTAPVNKNNLGKACHRMPFITGDLYLSTGDSTGDSTNLQTMTVTEGDSIRLNAVVQPIMSQTTLAIPNSYGADPGLLAIGSPALTKPVNFYEDGNLIGTASLSANGTLASLVVKNVRAGKHNYRAEYPADTYYDTLSFGLVNVQVNHPDH